jgi:hypothetical protein
MMDNLISNKVKLTPGKWYCFYNTTPIIPAYIVLRWSDPITDIMDKKAKRDMVYVYKWKNNEKRLSMYGRKCKVIVRGRANSALVEFEDGQREIISRNAIKKTKEV